jgi:RNA polymerase sigma factor (sigma-70 family)
MSDPELLKQYLDKGSEQAFTELVKRYVSLVYSTARRRTADPHVAEEATQQVFCLLARKAASLTKRPTLAGWLYRTTCFIAAKNRRAEARRRQHEQEAFSMNENEKTSEDMWQNLSPMLEDAMNQLGEKDRLALLLRFFQGKPMAKVGDTLGTTEAATKMRIGRALQQLREFFAKRGTACSVGALSVMLTEKTVKGAPAALTEKIAAVVSAQVGASAGATFFASVLGKSLVIGSAATVAVVAVVYVHTFTKNTNKEASANNKVTIAENHQTAINNSGITSDSQPQTTSISQGAGYKFFADTNLESVIAHLRLALNTPPDRQTHQLYDYQQITNAIWAFGDKRLAAFEVLKEYTGDKEEFVRFGAYSGIGYLGKSVPAAAPVLWNDFYSTSPQARRDPWIIFNALRNIGFGAWDLPQLTSLLSDSICDHNILTEQVPEAVSKVIQNNPQAAKPYLPAIENLLDDTSSNVQVRAALALLQTEGTHNPKVVSTLHELFQRPNDREGEYYKFLAAQILGDAGATSKPMVPDMLTFAKSAGEAGMQNSVYAEIARIEPDFAIQDTNVALAVKQQQDDQRWKEKWDSGSYTFDDLRVAIKSPHQALIAANHLAEMGSDAEPAVPDMIHAIWGKDEVARNEILADVYKVDPQATVIKIKTSRLPLGNALEVLDKEPKTQDNKDLIQELYVLEGTEWCLPDELAAFTNELAAKNPKAYQEYAKFSR